MRGGRQLAKPDVGRPLDGRVRLGARANQTFANYECQAFFVLAKNTRGARKRKARILVPKHQSARGTGEAGAYPTPAAWRCGTPQGQRETQALPETCALPRLLVRERQMIQGRRRAAPGDDGGQRR